MALLLSSILITILGILPLTGAYKIDPSSCGPYMGLVENSTRAAFDMAAIAREVLEQADPAKRNEDDDRLVQWLFNKKYPGRPLISGNTAYLSFRGLSDVSTRIFDRVITNTREVIIYCNYDRIAKNKEGVWEDTDMDCAFEAEQLKDLQKPGNALAVTFKHWNMKKPSQITISPWFLQWANHTRFTKLQDWAPRVVLAKLAIPAVTQGWPFAPIDRLNLLDKVILHELTHTTAGGASDDVVPDLSTAGKYDRIFYRGPAYGWHRASFLGGHAFTPARCPAGSKCSPEQNADSLALFASALRFRRLPKPMYVTNKGQLSSKMP